jgi:hypothetical protein
VQALKLERDSLDRWIKWALASNAEAAQPSDRVWRRIARRVVFVGEVCNMLLNHYEAERIVRDRVRDAQRRAEQRRLARAAGNPRWTRQWAQSVALLLAGLLPASRGRGAAVADADPLPSAAPSVACERCMSS